MDENMVTMEAPAPKPKKGIPILTVCAVLLVAAIVIGTVSAVFAADPVKQVEKACANNAEAMIPADGGRVQEILMNRTRMDVTWDVGLLLADVTGLPLDIDAAFSMCVDYDEKKSAASADVLFSGMSVLDALVVFDAGKYALQSDALLGGKAYGVDVTKLEENFPGSAFAQDESISAAVAEFIEVYRNQEGMKEAQKDAIAFLQELWTVLKDSVKENGTVEKASGVLPVADTDVPVTNVIFAADAEGFGAICEDVLLYCRDNEKLNRVIDAYNVQISGMTAEETKAELRLIIEDALSEIEAYKAVNDSDDGTVDVTVHISKSKKEIIGVTFTVKDADAEESNIRFVCGPDMDAITEISLVTEGLDEDESIIYLVEENSDAAYRAALTVADQTLFTVDTDKVNESVAAVLSTEDGDILFTADKDGNAFRASLRNYSDEEIGLTGSFIDTDEQYGIVLETISYEEQMIRVGNITFALSETDEMPEIGEFTEIMTMSEEELEALITQVETAIQTLLSAFVG